MAVDDAADALALVRLHELIAAGHAAVEQLTRDLEDYAPSAVSADEELEASSERQRRIVAGIEELVEAVELAHMLCEALLRRNLRSIDVGADAVERVAADWLRSGIADARQLRLAASLLPARDGLVALADALESVGEPWISEATLRDILGAFRQFPAPLVDRIGDEAAIDVDVRFEEIESSAIRPLIVALRHGADQLRTDEGRS